MGPPENTFKNPEKTEKVEKPEKPLNLKKNSVFIKNVRNVRFFRGGLINMGLQENTFKIADISDILTKAQIFKIFFLFLY